VHEHILALDVHQRLGAQPGQQFGPVGRGEDRVQRVLLVILAVTLGHHRQVKVVIAQDGKRSLA